MSDTIVLGTPVTGPIILAPPLDQTEIAGRSASFDVTASGTALRYQWQRGGTNILNATNRVVTFTNVPVAQEADYRALVSTGTATNSSRVARLTVAEGGTRATGRFRLRPTLGVLQGGDVDASGRAQVTEHGDAIVADRCVAVKAARLEVGAYDIEAISGRI